MPAGIISISGKALIQEVNHVKTSECQHDWMTTEKSQWVDQVEEYSHLEEGEAECVHCGTVSEVNDSEEKKNVILDKAGAEKITDLIASGTGAVFDHMKLGTGSTTTAAPAASQTQLENTVDTSPALTPAQQSTGGAQKKVVWSHTFPSGTGKTSIVSMGMDTQTLTGASAVLLNRLTFAAKDNKNNDLAITYELTVS